MTRKIARTIAVSAALIAAAGVSVAPVYAADGDVQPTTAASGETATGSETDEPLNEDLPIPGEADTEVPQPPTTKGEHCDPGQVRVITKNLKNTMSTKYHVYVENTKDYDIDYKFTSKKSGTTELGASVTVSGETKIAFLGKIQVDVNASATKSWTSELGVETSGKVKANSTVKGDYGIMKENVEGYTAQMYSNCETGDKTSMKVWAPYREGWIIS